MPKKSTLTKAKETSKKIEDLAKSTPTKKVIGIAEKLRGKEKLSLKEKADHALELKDATNKSFLEKTRLAEEVHSKSKKKKNFISRGVTGGFTGAMGLLIGKNKETEEFRKQSTEVVDKTVDIISNEEELRKTNDKLEEAIIAERKLKNANDKINSTWKFKAPEKKTDWFLELEEQEKKYKKYNHRDAWSEAWKNTEFEFDADTGEKKKRNFFFRILAFFPSLSKAYASWKAFETVKKSGAIEKAKEGKSYKDKAEAELNEAERKLDKGLEAKKEAFSSVFEENPGALQISKNYYKKLAQLTKNADKYTSAERAKLIKKYANQVAKKGVKEFGQDFAKMKGFEKHLPGVKLKQRGGFMLVEIVGKSLGAALREGSQEGGWARAMDTFKSEIVDADNWKDACPIWGTIRSAQRLGNDDGAPEWSKWTDFGLSLGMDIASVVGIVASFGSATPAILAARTAGGAAAKSGIRKLGMRQLIKQSAKKLTSKEISKEARKGFTKQAVKTAGGKWAVRINLMMTTIGEFFGEDIDEGLEEAKEEARGVLEKEILTAQQQRAKMLYEAAKNGTEIEPRESFEAPRNNNKEATEDAGIISSSTNKTPGKEDKEDKKKKTSSANNLNKQTTKQEPKGDNTFLKLTKKALKNQ